MAIPKEGYLTSSSRAATADLPGPRRATASRSSRRSSRGKRRPSANTARIEKTIAGLPDGLAVLKLHYLRWVLFDIKATPTSCTRASSTPTSTSTPRTRSRCSRSTGINTVFENLEGFPDGLEDEPAGVRQVRPRAPVPELPRVRRVPVRHGRRDQEGAEAQGGVLRRCSTRCSDRRGRCHARTRRHPALPADAHARADGALRVPLVPGRRRRTGLARRASSTRCSRRPTCRASVDREQALGDRRLHLERPARARRRRGLARHLSRGVPAGHGGPRRDARRHRRQPSRPLGGRPGQPGPPRHRHPVRARRRGARALPVASTQKLLAQCPGRRGALVAGSRGDPAVRLRPRSLRLPRSAVAAGDRGHRRASRRPAPARRSSRASSSSAIPTRTDPGRACRSPRSSRATAATWPIAGCEEHVGAFRDFLRAARRDARGAGAGRREADGPLAQRRAAGARAGRRTIRSSAPTCSATTTSTTRKMDPHGYAVPLGSHIRRMNPRDTAAQHEPPPDDPPRRHLRPAAARRRAGRRRRARHRRVRRSAPA